MSRLWLLCVFVYTCVVSGENPLTDPVTVSPSGVFRGSWMETRRGRRIQAYRGIRYAEPPVGELRFQPPNLILSYEDEVDAREDGPACPQAGNIKVMSEDCLRINVYTPNNNSSTKLPVIFFIHPGGFYEFSGRSVVFGPQYLLDKDVVLVTINYRLGSLGFLAMGTKEAPGNNGFKDQVAALEWVSLNIAEFGGDSNLVTLTGCSAGAIGVIGHMISPMSSGLFHRAIAMSGSPTSKVRSPRDRLDLAVKQAIISNCPTTSPKEIYDCLKTKPWQDIATNRSGFYEFGTDPLTLWRTVVEPDFGRERFLPVDPIAAVRAGPVNDVPIIISQTRDEFFWKAFSVLRNATLRTTLDVEWDHYAPHSFILPRGHSAPQPRALRHAYLGDRGLEDDDVTAERLEDDDVTAERLEDDDVTAERLEDDDVTAERLEDDDVTAERLEDDDVTAERLEDDDVTAERLEDDDVTAERLEDDDVTAERLGKLYGDAITGFPVHRLANLMCGHSKHSVWYYEFDYMGNHSFYENTTTKKPVGVAHQDDLLYLFPLSYRFPAIPADDSEDSKMVDKLTDIWYNFARYGDPNPVPEVSWPPMSCDSRRYLQLATKFTLQRNLKEERFSLWDELYPIQY